MYCLVLTFDFVPSFGELGSKLMPQAFDCYTQGPHIRMLQKKIPVSTDLVYAIHVILIWFMFKASIANLELHSYCFGRVLNNAEICITPTLQFSHIFSHCGEIGKF